MEISMCELQGGCGQERWRKLICLVRTQQKRRAMASQGAPEKELDRGSLAPGSQETQWARLDLHPLMNPNV